MRESDNTSHSGASQEQQEHRRHRWWQEADDVRLQVRGMRHSGTVVIIDWLIYWLLVFCTLTRRPRTVALSIDLSIGWFIVCILKRCPGTAAGPINWFVHACALGHGFIRKEWLIKKMFWTRLYRATWAAHIFVVYICVHILRGRVGQRSL